MKKILSLLVVLGTGSLFIEIGYLAYDFLMFGNREQPKWVLVWMFVSMAVAIYPLLVALCKSMFDYLLKIF